MVMTMTMMTMIFGGIDGNGQMKWRMWGKCRGKLLTKGAGISNWPIG
jgi:hypothetical protein